MDFNFCVSLFFQFRDILDEEAVSIGLVNHPDLYQFIGNNALSDPRFAGIVPCDQYNKAVKSQLISKGLFGVIVWTKNPTKFF
jgi:hypothetical protein